MSEIKRVRLNAEQAAEQYKAVRAIVALTEQIKEYAEKMEGKTCKEAYLNSVKNLETKNEIYGKEKEILTDDEKKIVKAAQEKALADFRAQKKNDEVPADTEAGTDEPVSEISESPMEEVKQENKKKGKKSH